MKKKIIALIATATLLCTMVKCGKFSFNMTM